MMTKEYADQRIPELEAVCRLRPNSLALADLAACYFTINESEKALPLAKKAWEIRRHASIAMSLCLIYKDLGLHEEAFTVAEQAYFLNPDDAYIQMGYGEALLKAGFWKQGWPVYNNARPTQQAAAIDLGLPQSVKEWNGEDLPEGHQLIVINEGGTGDRISYARFLTTLTARNINWVFYPYAELFSFFERILPREKLIKDGEDTNPTHWTTTFALPAQLNLGPTEVPEPLHFIATSEAIEKYKIPRVDKLPIVGLCYSAAEKFQGGRKVRSLSEGQAMRLVCQTADKIHWVNLQYGLPMPFPVNNVDIKTWEDTAGLIHNLDAVVSVDTGIMHLAGAMKKPMAVLLSANSCWKFLKNRKRLPLYPDAKFYRNDGFGRGFEHAISELVVAIRNNSAW